MKREESGETYTVVGEMNAHGALTLRTHETNATYHVVEYAHERLRERLETLSAGTPVKMELTRAGSRGNGWRADGVYLRSESAGDAAAGG
jgi:hypothetical protein